MQRPRLYVTFSPGRRASFSEKCPQQRANGFSTRTSAIVWPSLRSSERSRTAPDRAADARMSASQNPIFLGARAG